MEYLRQLELLARAVVSAAFDEGLLADGDVPEDASRLQRAVNELDRTIRRYHFEGDGCLDEEADRPLIKLEGVVILRPEAMPHGMGSTYQEICAQLGVEVRPEGWAVWNTWGKDRQSKDRQPVSVILTDLAGTEGVLLNWARGISAYPVVPVPSQIVMVRQGWIEPMTLSPGARRRLDINGHP